MKRVLIEFMDSIRNYVFESGADIAHDERESSEFVDIFLKDRPAKRHPDPNGVLKLTPEELEEFAMLNKSSPNVVVFISGGQVFCRYDKFEFSVYRYESILWLSNLFELEV